MAAARAPSSCCPHELPALLDRYAGLKVLSLDCFDTLLWRDCHAPTDLFAALTDCTMFQRAHGEQRARQIVRARHDRHDVAIDEIYRAIMPDAGDADRARAIAAELDLEARHCYGFAPTIALMRAARRRGMQVILVSDTYLDPQQLHDLVARAAGADVAALIDRVFCSSTYGMPKAGGLYRHVLAQLQAGSTLAPAEILHIGDNAAADVEGVAPFGVQTLHLQQFTARTAQQLRLESAVGAMLHGHGCTSIQAPQPHRAALAVEAPRLTDPAEQFGFATLGPVLFGFDQWLRDEASALQAQHQATVHWLFLMRDGYLPMAIHRAAGAQGSIQAIEISRLTATFSAFADDRAIMRHLEENRGIDPAILARQLRLPPATITQLCSGRSHADGWRALAQWCGHQHNRTPIVKAAQACAARLVAHVQQAVRPAAGDTLMLVDLGYNGTVQSLVALLLAQALNVQVAGRYLILREVQVSGHDKRGYLSQDTYDPVVLNAMTANVAVIEQLATTATGSVIDYTDDGQPLRDTCGIARAQSVVREAVQRGCLGFVGAARAHVVRPAETGTLALWRRANAATLLRLMYLPMREELSVIDAFEHDVNLGTAETLPLYDPVVARKGLLQQGLFYQKGARRMFLPAELADQGFATRLTHLATARFHMPLTAADFADETGRIGVILSHAGNAVQIDLPFRPTHDGFCALVIPVGAGRYDAAVLFGAIARHVEVQSIVAMPASEYLAGRHDSDARTQPIVPRFEGIVPLGDSLWHCPDPAGCALLGAPVAQGDANMVIVVVFRIIAAA
jgi:FMN phosphatase YigB (HAD superfamily)